MIYYDEVDASEGIDVNKTSESKECDICHYWYLLNKGFKFQTYVSNRCHDLLMMSMNLSDNAILNIIVYCCILNSTDYCCIISRIRESEVINLMQNLSLTKNKWNIIKHKFFYHV